MTRKAVGGIITLLRQQFGEEQLPYLLGWLKVAIRSAKTHKYMPGQALGLFGRPGTGKTFIQDHLITPLLGGRDAKPYQFMCGKTDFNADLFAGEHLVISDENAHTDLASRRNFGTKIKDLCVNHRQKLHEKRKTGFMVAPFWLLSISANDEPENLMIMPPIDRSIADKVMLFKIDMPESLPDDEQREEFAAQIKSELRAFVGYLGRFLHDPEGVAISPLWRHALPSPRDSRRNGFGVEGPWGYGRRRFRAASTALRAKVTCHVARTDQRLNIQGDGLHGDLASDSGCYWWPSGTMSQPVCLL